MKKYHFERRGNMIYGEDNGPGTAPFIAECSSVERAEEIVLRLNAHDALVAALERVEPYLTDAADLASRDYEDRDLSEMLSQARAALAAVTR